MTPPCPSRRSRRSPEPYTRWLCALAALSLSSLVASCGPVTPGVRAPGTEIGPDEDADGVPDIDDPCPTEPEDGLLPKNNDGCPAPDADRDGVAIDADRCPDAKEDRLLPRPKDGCPIGDSDHDGVGDTEDRCSDRAEDNLDPDPNDGCPSPDGDADGVPDVTDVCPRDPETINGYRDLDGCPDSPPVATVLDRESSEIAVSAAGRPSLYSETSDLTPEAKATLAEVAKALREHPEIERLEIEVHTSTRGDPAYNVQLTERRAGVLAQGLVKLGVPPGKLVPIGYGEQCPAIDRGDEVEEPRNRRVMFKVVQIDGAWQSIPRGCWRAQVAGLDPTKRKPLTISLDGQP